MAISKVVSLVSRLRLKLYLLPSGFLRYYIHAAHTHISILELFFGIPCTQEIYIRNLTMATDIMAERKSAIRSSRN